MGEPTQILQLRAQIHQYDTVIKERTAQQEELKRQIEIYQARVAATPEIEQEYKLITRDHDTVLGAYNDLLKRRNDYKTSTQYQEKKQDDRFVVLDPANLPVEPAFPKLPMFAGGGFGAGLALAVGISLLLEMQDTSMRSEHDVEIVSATARAGDDSGDFAEYGEGQAAAPCACRHSRPSNPPRRSRRNSGPRD